MNANVEITALDLSFRRKALAGFTVGLALYVVVVAALYLGALLRLPGWQDKGMHWDYPFFP